MALAEGRADLGRQAAGPTTSGSRLDVAEAYDRYGREIFQYSLNALRDGGVAEECTQETFTRAWMARRRYDAQRSSLRTWLYAIARNVITDAHRRGARVAEPVDDEQLQDLHADVVDPNENLMLIEALAALTSDHRQAVVAIHLTGLSYAELSTRTQVPVATLRTRTYYGLRALRRYYEWRETEDG